MLPFWPGNSISVIRSFTKAYNNYRKGEVLSRSMAYKTATALDAT